MKNALIIIDLQKEYTDSGIMPIPYVETLVGRIKNIVNNFDYVFTTKCVNKQISTNKLDRIMISDTSYYCITPESQELLIKGYDTYERGYGESFSAKNAKNGDITLIDTLKNNGVRDVYLCGVPGEYSVKYTALELMKQGFNINIIIDCIKTLYTDITKLSKSSILYGFYILNSNDVKLITKSRKLKPGEMRIDVRKNKSNTDMLFEQIMQEKKKRYTTTIRWT